MQYKIRNVLSDIENTARSIAGLRKINLLKYSFKFRLYIRHPDFEISA